MTKQDIASKSEGGTHYCAFLVALFEVIEETLDNPRFPPHSEDLPQTWRTYLREGTVRHDLYVKVVEKAGLLREQFSNEAS